MLIKKKSFTKELKLKGINMAKLNILTWVKLIMEREWESERDVTCYGTLGTCMDVTFFVRD